MTEAYRIAMRETGGPEVLEREPLGKLAPGDGELLIRNEAIGLNFIDTYYRSGLYPTPLPSGLGNESAGIVEATGEGVEGFRPGDRVGVFSGPLGAYATHRIVAAERAVKLPDAIGSEVAAAAMLKGCTAEFLIERCARVEPGQTVLVHAAAGGVGSILVPWLKAIGARVIAHAGSPAKAQQAREAGAEEALSCPMEELAAQVRALTDGKGVPIVLDGVGAASWEASLQSTARRGLIVTYGNASGPVPPFTPLDLVRAGSLFVTRPTLFDYIATPDEMRASAARLFEMIGSDAVPVRIGARYPLSDAAEAHRALESRNTTGSTLLIP
ncbi:quinone oxidoreductase [Sphingosinicella sp. LY1275]|uniref:quinone oxidoreductase family protein n=1 Tax=Sphingosinicella sp. LY1275 TaxID=3095379 RepID=UPI002ADEF3F7|nr:quinone oxidoreductase [Sphingosinicella sp. LY1275]MEA1014256.1 quinone oxidoreductase [Sphingosinicella sp. LY1275]